MMHPQEHIAYDWQFISSKRDKYSILAERACAVARRVDTQAAMRSYYQGDKYLRAMRAMDVADPRYVRVEIPVFFRDMPVMPKVVREYASATTRRLSGRRWQDKTPQEIIAHLQSVIQPGEWLSQQELRTRAQLATRHHREYLRMARELNGLAFYWTRSKKQTPMCLYALPGTEFPLQIGGV